MLQIPWLQDLLNKVGKNTDTGSMSSTLFAGQQKIDDDIASLNDLSAAEVNAEVDTALNTAIPSSNTADSVNDILLDQIKPRLPLTGTLATTNDLSGIGGGGTRLEGAMKLPSGVFYSSTTCYNMAIAKMEVAYNRYVVVLNNNGTNYAFLVAKNTYGYTYIASATLASLQASYSYPYKIVRYATSGGTEYYAVMYATNSGNYPRLYTISATASTIMAGTYSSSFSTTSQSGVASFDVCSPDPNKLTFVYQNGSDTVTCTYTMSGTSFVSLGSPCSLGVNSSNNAIDALDTDKVLVMYGTYSSTYGRIVTISGTTNTNGTQYTLTNLSNCYVRSLHAVSSTAAVFVGLQGNTSICMGYISISGSVVTECHVTPCEQTSAYSSLGYATSLFSQGKYIVAAFNNSVNYTVRGVFGEIDTVNRCVNIRPGYVSFNDTSNFTLFGMCDSTMPDAFVVIQNDAWRSGYVYINDYVLTAQSPLAGLPSIYAVEVEAEDFGTGTPGVVAVPSSTSANTFGSWTQLCNAPITGVIKRVNILVPTGSDYRAILEIGIGSSGYERPVLRHSILPVVPTSSGYTYKIDVGRILVPAGERVVARMSDSSTSALEYKIILQFAGEY